ncbi:zinc finger protein 236-like [Sabethes cyaneus]|uniref:zinc finger protein 236-like n=1 Tax=Sabethes cyaneus TaxID=53552 RepID=UPI00237D70A8|nr:zinc finger protein 236-like [Sabethes cyaneus]
MSLALNFERKCRTCGTDILELTCGIPIFGSGLQLDHKIQRYLGLNISLHDNLPKCLCATCFIKIESIDKFAILAKKTEEAYLGWFKCIRANMAKRYNSLQPGQQPSVSVASTALGAGSGSPKIDYGLLTTTIGEQIAQGFPRNAETNELQAIKMIKPEISIISYSDLKIGLLIKDQELLKLILKALRWAEHDQKASYEVLIQRLKNTTFREILSNHNLLNDSDLTQLLKSYIGQEAYNKFTAGNVSPDVCSLMSSRAATIQPVIASHPSTAMATSSCSLTSYKIDENSVTQMEVGVDPSLFLDDEESQNRSKAEAAQKPQESVVTIKLVPANLTSSATTNEKMIPAILKYDVRSNGNHICTNCPATFATNTDLQQHIVTSHLISCKKQLLAESFVDKKMIKIRVKKHKLKTPQQKSVKPQENNETPTIPISIPPATTITVIPAPVKSIEPIQPEPRTEVTKDLKKQLKLPELQQTSTKQLQKSAPKNQTKSKRKPEQKLTIKIDQILSKRTRSQLGSSGSGSSRRSKLICTVCRKRMPSKAELKSHMESHLAKGKYTCEKCDRVFNSALNLSRHRQYHAGEKFSCDRCRRVYPTSSTLRAHKVTHSDARPHKCQTCGKTFKRNQDLKFHMNQHTGARPYKCPHCTKSFASSGNCFSHRKRMHANQLPADSIEKENVVTRSSKKC